MVNTEQWQGIQRGCYIPPDTLVKTNNDNFSFLSEKAKDGKARIKTMRLRGVWSQGLLVPADEYNVGDDLWEKLELEHYEPELHNVKFGKSVPAPEGFRDLSKYDIENGRGKYGRMFTDGEIVVVSSKLHGANTSAVYTDKLYVHSRAQWPEDGENVFWRAVKGSPGIEKFCRDNPKWMVYGETIGMNPGFKYDCANGEVKFKAFDILQPDRNYVCADKLEELCNKYEIPMAPILGRFPYSFEKMCELAEHKCTLGNKISEGVVIRPLAERYTKYGRAIAKFINPAYLEKN